MAEILKLLIIISLFYLLARALVFLFKRCVALARIYSLKKECNAKICLHRFPFSPFQSKGENPDITVEIFDTVYAIRLYSGVSGSSLVHFVDEKYSVVYKRLRTMIMPSRSQSRAGRGIRLSYATGGRVSVMSRMKHEKPGKRTVNVLLFSPAPYEVSFVTEERSTIRLAFTGDTLYGYRVFTASTLCVFIDREKRRMEEEQKSDPVFGNIESTQYF